MSESIFQDHEALSDALLAQEVGHALRGLGIASNGKGEAGVRSAVAALGGKVVPHLAAPSLAADRHGQRRHDCIVTDQAESAVACRPSLRLGR